MRQLVVLLLIVGVWAAAATVDFEQQVVVVSSEGGESDPGPEMVKAALDALRQAVYDRDRTVEQFLAANPAAERRFGRLRLDWRRGATRYRSDGPATTDFHFSYLGPFLNLVLPATGNGRLLGPTACPCCGQPWPADREPPAGVKLVPLETGGPTDYTGVLIDATELDPQPAFFPAVVTEDNREVFGPGFADPAYLAERGAVRYYTSRVAAQNDERIGTRPLLVRAVAVAGRNRCDLVVSQYDAVRLHGSRNLLKLLAECRVGVIRSAK